MKKYMHHYCLGLFWVAILTMIWTGCGAPEQKQSPTATHSHHHDPPHGGSLIQLGNEQYHLELVMDQDLSLMQCYVLDGHLEHFIRLGQEEILCETTLSSGLKTNLVFQATASRSTGETVGDTAEFQADLAPLNGEITFEGIIQKVHIRNSSFTNIPFSFPGGNE